MSKHDNVSRNITLINNSLDRLANEIKIAPVKSVTTSCKDDGEDVESALILSDGDILSDPQKNVPLKIVS